MSTNPTLFEKKYMTTFLKHNLTIKETWLASLQLYRKAFPKIWYLALSIGIVSITPKLTVSFSSKIGAIVCYIATFLAWAYLACLVLYRTYNISGEQDISLQNSIKYTNKRYIKVAISILITSLLFILTTFILAFLGFVIFVLFTAIPPSKNLLIAKYIGIIASGLSLALVGTLLAIVEPLILFDDRGIWSAFKSSCKLIWSNWWHSFMALLPFEFFYMIGSLMADYRLTLPQHGWYILSGDFLVNILSYPLLLVCTIILFNDLKLRKNKTSIIAAESTNL